MRSRTDLGLKGHMRLRVYEADTGLLVAQREADNLMVAGGVLLVTEAAAWVLMQNYNSSFGSPFSSSWGNLGNVYGAIGSSNTPALVTQSTLGLETARANLSIGATNSNVITLDFFFGTSQGQGTIAEAGVFLQAGLVTTTLTTALAVNTNYTSLSVAALTAAIPTGAAIVLNYGVGGVQILTTTAQANIGATTISVGSFTANAPYAVGATVAYAFGTMLDRVVFPTPYTKSSSQVATLELDVALLAG